MSMVKDLLQPAIDGVNIGIMSESGCPGIADPGAKAVNLAHKLDIQVVPMVGPSSIFLALMASGFNGQCFKFHGYLPAERQERINKIKLLEKESRKLGQSQIFIETPYRNDHMLEDLIGHCQGETQICVARDITGGNELIKTQKVINWKNDKPD